MSRKPEGGRTRRRLALLAGVALCGGSFMASAQESAMDIVRKSEALTRGDTQVGTYSLVIIRPDWRRTIVFDSWATGSEKAFIRILEPVKERGVSFLKIKREMWQYVPRINRVIKIPPSMMSQSWMGSGFTNDDLVRESSLLEDYRHALLGKVETDDGEAYQVELIPKPDAPIAWDRLLMLIRVADFAPVRAEFFNERGDRVRLITYHDFRQISGRVIPTRFELVEDRWPDRKTVMTMDDVRYNARIDNSVFTQANLRRSR